MSLTSGDQVAIIAVGATLVVGTGAGIFKSASLRGDMNARWNRRVDFAVAALDEKTIAELEQLRDDVDDIFCPLVTGASIQRKQSPTQRPCSRGQREQ